MFKSPTPNKLDILSHRSKLRDSLKVCIVTPLIQTKPFLPEDKDSPLQERVKASSPPLVCQNNLKRRKRSQDLSVFQNPSKVKEVYITENFFSLFQQGQKLGEGAQSVVRKCTEKASQLVYAVKLFRSSDCELINTLKSQFKILKSLSHPNVITAKYLFIDERANNSQLVLEYCEYPHLVKGVAYPPDEASEILGQLLQAVTYLHEKGVCHRDIKPENVLYDPVNRVVKVIDFEIAKNNRNRLERLQMWTMTGTIYYKAPEMFAGKYNELVDVWSIGVLAYQMLTGKLPFYDQYMESTIELIKSSEPEYPPYLSPFAKDFLKRCLTKNPLKRPSAKEMCSSPFLLQFDSRSSVGSPTNPDKLNRSFDSKANEWITVVEEQQQQFCGFKLNRVMDDTGQSEYNSQDIGIRCFTEDQ